VRVEDAETPAPLAAKGAFQQRNFALACRVAETYLKRMDAGAPDAARYRRAVRDAARSTEMRGRLQAVAVDPPTLLDGAHNPAAVHALVAALPELLGARPLGLVLGVLEDKDAVGMLQPLLALCERAWFTAPPSSRALSPAALQSLARQLGFAAAKTEPRPGRALADAQRGARRRGAAVLATGSVYLVGELLGRGGDADTVESPDDRACEAAR
jgi:dihydrofolate synthase / folylpolyglutamate synthase